MKIGLTYDEIKIMTKNSFKNFVKKRTKEAEFEYLNTLKKKHSKVEFIEHTCLKIHPYFLADECEKTIRELQNLFQNKGKDA